MEKEEEEEEGARFSKTRIKISRVPKFLLFISISFAERRGRGGVVTSCVGFNEPVNYSERSKEDLSSSRRFSFLLISLEIPVCDL